MIEGTQSQARPSLSKHANTPTDVTAATSRNTQTPTKRSLKKDDLIEEKKYVKSIPSKSLTRMSSDVKIPIMSTLRIPKGLKKAHKSNLNLPSDLSWKGTWYQSIGC